jgi:hypothetical protein
MVPHAGTDSRVHHEVRALGAELGALYDGAPLPDGTPGRLDFTTRSVVPRQ